MSGQHLFGSIRIDARFQLATMRVLQRIEVTFGGAIAWIATKLIQNVIWALTWPLERIVTRRHRATEFYKAAKRQETVRRSGRKRRCF